MPFPSVPLPENAGPKQWLALEGRFAERSGDHRGATLVRIAVDSDDDQAVATSTKPGGWQRPVSVTGSGRLRGLFQLPDARLFEGDATFELLTDGRAVDGLRLRRLGPLRLAAAFLRRYAFRHGIGGLLGLPAALILEQRRGGRRWLRIWLRRRVIEDYGLWTALHLGPADGQDQRPRSLPASAAVTEPVSGDAPEISLLVVPSFGEPAPARGLESTLSSIDRQTRRGCRVILAEELGAPNASFATLLAAAFEIAHRADPKGYLAVVESGDTLDPRAIELVSERLSVCPDAALLIADQDQRCDRGVPCQPVFKPEWNLELLRSTPYLGRPIFFPVGLARRLGAMTETMDPSVELDLTFRIAETVPRSRLVRLPIPIYRRSFQTRSAAGAGVPNAEAFREVVTTHLDRSGIAAEVLTGERSPELRIRYPLPSPPPLVSAIVPTRDQPDLLAGLMEGLLDETSYPSLEVVVVDNGSQQAETRGLLEQLPGRDQRVRVESLDAPFNFSALINHGARVAHGQVLALLNDDLRVRHPEWLDEMVRHALRAEVGAVGAKLFYADGTIQHAGAVLGVGNGIAGHSFRFFPGDHPGSQRLACVAREVSAVTAACLVVRRDAFLEVEGLDAVNLPVAFNDVDFCLRLRERGYVNVWTPWAQLDHLESASRGPEIDGVERERSSAERAWMLERWGSQLRHDPYYSPNLTLEREDHGLEWAPRWQS